MPDDNVRKYLEEGREEIPQYDEVQEGDIIFTTQNFRFPLAPELVQYTLLRVTEVLRDRLHVTPDDTNIYSIDRPTGYRRLRHEDALAAFDRMRSAIIDIETMMFDQLRQEG